MPGILQISSQIFSFTMYTIQSTYTAFAASHVPTTFEANQRNPTVRVTLFAITPAKPSEIFAFPAMRPKHVSINSSLTTAFAISSL